MLEDEGAVDQDDLSAPRGDPFQGAVQTRGADGEQGYQLVSPAPYRRFADLVAAGRVGDALVVAEHGEDDDDDLFGLKAAPARADRLEMAAQQGRRTAHGTRSSRPSWPTPTRKAASTGRW
ncbi:hypothetical protein ACGF0K_39985 [Streptomyces sp. NPDC048156]|uniref:hypothetical protein n=1 Tax=Streptomyces sp. NPDC048156 TaxID=3365502 RepID=UPI003711685F